MSRDFIYEKLIRPVLFSADPEAVHHLAASALSSGAFFLPAMQWKYTGTILKTKLFGTEISNPIGLAAGFDKNGKSVPLLSNLGFGFAEIGSVCARPHGGNERPRLFRLPEDHGLINRLGLNGLGVEVVASRLERLRLHNHLPIGVNIAKTNDPRVVGDAAVEDICYTFERMKDLPVKYFTINTSCPNTHEGALKETAELSQILSRVVAANSKKAPILLKLSPDSTDDFISEVIDLATKFEVAGFVCGNTSVRRDTLKTSKERLDSIGNGGLSGKPIKPFGLELTRKVANGKSAEQIIMGVGGIENGVDVLEYLKAGANFVQLYTGFVYRGPSAVKGICQELEPLFAAR